MKLFPIFTVLLLSSLFVNGQQIKTKQSSDLKLWYKQAANDWNKALPIGNGRLGAVVFGGVKQEQLQLQLNEESLWQGKKKNNNNPAALKNLPKIRQLIFEGKTNEAMSLANESLNGNPGSVKSYQPLGNLTFGYDFPSDV